LNFHSLDLNLLLVFDALMKTRSVTLAGEKLGLSQSSTSNALQRLRNAFADPLFVRTPKGMEPSALAQELELPIRGALDQLRAVVERDQVFDPANASRTFRVLMSDIAQSLHMPALVSVMRREAPSLHLENVALSLKDAKRAMADGELDMAIGFLPDLGADFRRQSLFAESWVCVLSKKHPHIRDSLSKEEYLAAKHISFRPAVAIHSVLDELLEKEFTPKGINRSIGLTVPYSSGLGLTVAASDLVLTVPVGLAMTMIGSCDVRLMKLPFDLPTIDLNMQWHERVHRDPGGKWLREVFGRRYRAKKAAV
jgi:DNA-binding transcriptional LysR family regulator